MNYKALVLGVLLFGSSAWAAGNTNAQSLFSTNKNGPGVLNYNTSGTLTLPNVTGTLATAAGATANLAIVVSNDSSTGTTLNKLATINTSGNAINATTSSFQGVVGVVSGGAGTTSSATITQAGIASCVFDGATTSGDYVQTSTVTAGDCSDTSLSSPPTNGNQILGQVLTTNGSGGTYSLLLSTGGGGGGISLPVSVANGGTGQATALLAFTTFFESVATSIGDFVYGGASGTPTRLARNTVATKYFMAETGPSPTPSWGPLVSGDIPNNAANTSGNAATATTATNATNVSVTANGSSINMYPAMSTSSSTGNDPLQVYSGFSFNPGTGVATATTFSGALSGNASTATTATTATVTGASANQSYYPVVVPSPQPSVSPTPLGLNDLSSISLNPSTSNVTANTHTAGVNNTTDGAVVFESANSIYTTTVKPAPSPGPSPSWTMSLPATAGSSNYYLQTDGTGKTTWATATPSFSGFTQYGFVYAATTSTLGETAECTSGQVPIGNGAGAPTCATVPGNSTIMASPTFSSATASGTGTGGFGSTQSGVAWYVGGTLAHSVASACVFSNDSHNFTVAIPSSTSSNYLWTTCTVASSGCVTSGTALTYVSGGASCYSAGNIANTISTVAVPTYTYTTPTSPGPLYLLLSGIGGGGGGGNTAGSGSSGAPTLFIPANASQSASQSVILSGGAPGTTVTNGAISANPVLGAYFGGSGVGGAGTSGSANNTAAAFLAGGPGGNGIFGGGGAGGGAEVGGSAGAPNTGAGGGGGSTNDVALHDAGGGGGAGAWVQDLVIPNPAATYYYAIGPGGAGATSGDDVGGAGGAGVWNLWEKYQ